MYRVTRMAGNIYAMKFDNLYDEVTNLEGLIEIDGHVLLVTDLETAADIFGVAEEDIVIVEPE